MGHGKGGKKKYVKPPNPTKHSGGTGTNPKRDSKKQDSAKVHDTQGKNKHSRVKQPGKNNISRMVASSRYR